MFGGATPSDSSNPKFFFRARMTVTNTVESSQTMASTERASDEVLEVTLEVEEFLSTPTKGKQVEKKKSKGKGQEQGKGRATKWDGGKLCTSPQNVKSP